RQFENGRIAASELFATGQELIAARRRRDRRVDANRSPVARRDVGRRTVSQRGGLGLVISASITLPLLVSHPPPPRPFPPPPRPPPAPSPSPGMVRSAWPTPDRSSGDETARRAPPGRRPPAGTAACRSPGANRRRRRSGPAGSCRQAKSSDRAPTDLRRRRN